MSLSSSRSCCNRLAPIECDSRLMDFLLTKEEHEREEKKLLSFGHVESLTWSVGSQS